MQLALTPDVLLPLGAGVVLLAALVIVVLVLRRRRRRSERAISAAATPEATPTESSDAISATTPLTVAEAVRDRAPAPAPAVVAATPAGEPQPVAAPSPSEAPSSEAPAAAEPAAEAATPAEPAPDAPWGPWREPQRNGSGRTVAAAVAQALAARDAQARSGDGAVTPGRGDARDRLLAVLLDDPARAVGAAVELEACRRQLDRLTAALRHERDTLGDVLGRLSSAGLRPDQLARLSGMTDDEVRSLLPVRSAAS